MTIIVRPIRRKVIRRNEMKLENRIHSHPKMEKDKNLDDNHIIIDKELYLELLRKLGHKWVMETKE